MNIKADKKNRSANVPPEEDKGKFVTVFTDGSHCPETKAWGIGIWIRYAEESPVELSYGGIGMDNCSEVETEALSEAVAHLLETYDLTNKVVVIQSDALGVLQKMQLAIKQQLAAAGAKYVKLKHVKGHASGRTPRTAVNKIVDRLAYKKMDEFRKKAREG